MIRTARLLLNDYNLEDVDSVFELRNHPEMNKFLNRKKFEDVNESRKHINNILDGQKQGKWENWAIRLNYNPLCIGNICLWNFSKDRKIAELGYGLHPEYRMNGYMLEAAQSILDYGFGSIGLHSIDAITHAKNRSSVSLLKKLGFSLQKDALPNAPKDNLCFTLMNKNIKNK